MEILGDRLRRGDEAALDTLLTIYWGRLVRYAGGIVGCDDVAEDLVQEAFVRLWTSRRTRPPGASLVGFLYATTRNLCLNERRRRRLRVNLSFRRIMGRPPPATPLEDVQASEMAVALRSAIETLPARRKEIFLLAREHRLSYQEIAAVMGLSRQTVANQMSAALERLRDVVRDFS